MKIEVIPDKDFEGRGKSDRDRAKDGLPLERLESMISDAQNEPPWRERADLCCAYYDGAQLTAQQHAEAEQIGLKPRVSNLIKPVINGVLGQEAKSRRDPKLEPDDDEGADVADVLQVKLKQAQRETYADIAISDAYASQVKAGRGWVEVSRCSDPLSFGYRVQSIHRNSIWVDRRAKRPDRSDARWLIRHDWRDLDEAVAAFPEHEQVLRLCMNRWANWNLLDAPNESLLAQANEDEFAFGISRGEWLDNVRKRIRLYEVWYRAPAFVVAMKVGQRWITLDENNPLHMEAAARGLVPLRKGMTMQVRMSLFAGPYRLMDVATTRRRFPYVQFEGFTTDKDGTPYGMVHSMIDPQDDYNERYLRIQWMLKAQQLVIEENAVAESYNSIKDIQTSMMRPDMVAVMKTGKLGAMQFRNDLSLQQEQFETMQHAKALIEQTSGVYATQLGNAPSGVTSGLAINSLVEQGLVSMGELNDNYALSRRLVYELLTDLIAEDHATPNLSVKLGSGSTKRVVVLNTVDPKTNEPVNMVKDSAVNVGLSEVPASPAYQMQQAQQMGDMIRALAGSQAAMLLLPSYVENNTSFGPNRRQLADDMRRQSGMPISGDSQGAQEWQAQQQQAASQAQQLQSQAAQIKLAADEAATILKRAQAMKAAAEAQAIATEPDEDALIHQVLQEAAGSQPATA